MVADSERGLLESVLLERAADLRRIEDALDAARAGVGTLVLIEGPAGIGKTELLLAARRRAAEARMAIVSGRGSELERESAYGVVRQLLEPVVLSADPAEVFNGAAVLAEPLFAPVLLVADGELGADQTFAVLHGLYWVCANLSHEGPLLLAVDDAHWADLASLRFLAYLAQRLEGLPLALLVAAGPAETTAEEELLVTLATEPGAVAVQPLPLSEAAVAELLRTELGREAEPAFGHACHTVTGGTPFLVRELIRELQAQQIEPVSASAGRVDGLGPRSVARSVVARLRRLGPGALELARAAAVLRIDADPRLAARLAGLDEQDAPRILDLLAEAGMLASARPVDLVHPIVRSAIYSEIPAGERSRLHWRAARLLADAKLPEEAIASHLLASEPSRNPWAVEILARTARLALGRGAPGSAIAYLERALAEPPTDAELAHVLHQLARAHAMDGHGEQLRERFPRAIAASRTKEQAAEIGLDFGRALASAGDFGPAAAAFSTAIADLPDEDGPLAVTIESELFTIGRGDTIRDRFRRRLVQLAAGELDDPSLLAPLALWLVNTKPPAAEGADVAERAAQGVSSELNAVFPGCVGNALLGACRLGRADEVYADAVAGAHRTGSRLTLGWTSALRARVAMERGDLPRARSDGRLGYELLRDAARDRTPSGYTWSCANLVEILVACGAIDEAETVLHGLAEGPPSYGRSLLLGARSGLRLTQARAEEALADALGSSELAPRNPAARPWRSDAAFALRALNRADEARHHATEELQIAREFDVPRAVGRALRALAACEERSPAVALLREAVAMLESSEARLELARALVDLGAALRRIKQRRECLEPLRRGLDLAHRSGAAPLADRARSELVIAGARPRRAALSGVQALTPSERRVADLAAAGMTNREIAQALFITARTVEGHLTHVFRKLDIESRDQLAERLAARAG